jgi:hypothetical protein
MEFYTKIRAIYVNWVIFFCGYLSMVIYFTRASKTPVNTWLFRFICTKIRY